MDHPQRIFLKSSGFLVLVFILLVMCTFPKSVVAQGRYYFFPGLALYGEFNDNVLLSEAVPVSDYLTVINPVVRAGYSSRRADIEGAYEARANFYKDNTELDNLEQRGTANFFIHASRNVELFATNSTTYSPNSDYRDPSGIFIQRSTGLYNYTSGGGTYIINERWRTAGNYTLALSRYEDPTFPDRTDHTATARLIYALSPKNELAGDYIYQRFDFPTGDLGTNKLGAGLTHRFSLRTRMEIYGGPMFIPQGFSNPLGQVKFHGRFDLLREFEGFLFAFNVSRDIVSVSESEDGDVALRTGAFVTFTKDFTRKFQGHLRGSYGLYRSVGIGGTDTDNGYFEAGSAYKLARWASLVAIYNHIYQKSRGEIGTNLNYNRFRIGVMFHRASDRFSF